MCVISYSYDLLLYYNYIIFVELDWVDSLNIELSAARNCGATDRSLCGAEPRHGGGTSADRFHQNVMKTTAAVFPRGFKKRKPNNDDKHGHGQEKRRPTTLS